jgi:hypothetical protein
MVGLLRVGSSPSPWPDPPGEGSFGELVMAIFGHKQRANRVGRHWEGGECFALTLTLSPRRGNVGKCSIERISWLPAKHVFFDLAQGITAEPDLF